MSGQLVGEVLAASEAFKAAGLSERGFHALLAIAEKCHTETRQGSVPWKHVCAGLYGGSKRTAERAVQDLKTFGAVRVVKPGFITTTAVVCIDLRDQPLTDTDTQVAGSSSTDTDKTGDRDRQTGDRYDTQVSVLDGLINGSPNGARGKADASRAAIRAAIDDCNDCDEYGRLRNLTDCPKTHQLPKRSERNIRMTEDKFAGIFLYGAHRLRLNENGLIPGVHDPDDLKTIGTLCVMINRLTDERNTVIDGTVNALAVLAAALIAADEAVRRCRT